MKKSKYTKLRMRYTDEALKNPPVMSKVEKEARLFELAKKIGVKIGGAK